ncbi:putative Response regulatory domain-containing protein [Gammaproteobacteria bacterium]
MSIQSFDFATGKVVEAKKRQAVILIKDKKTSLDINRLLRDFAYRILGQSNDAREVLPLLAKHKNGVLILDMDIEGLDAMAIMAAVKQGYPDFKVVMVTREPTKEKLQAALGAGAASFLATPIDRDLAHKILTKLSI